MLVRSIQINESVALGLPGYRAASRKTITKVSRTISQASNLLRQSRSLAEVEALCDVPVDDDSFALATVLMRLFENGHIHSIEAVIERMRIDALAGRISAPCGSPYRQTFIDYFKRDGLIDISIPMREIKPCGSLILPIHIASAIDRIYGCMWEDLIDRKRFTVICTGRFIAFWILRTANEQSLPQIGNILQRDHSTVLHGINQLSSRMETEIDLRDQVDAIRADAERAAARAYRRRMTILRKRITA